MQGIKKSAYPVKESTLDSVSRSSLIIPQGQDAAVDFFQAIFGNVSEGWFNIWTADNKRSEYFPVQEIDRAVQFVMKLRELKDIYFSIGVRRENLGPFKRGENQDISYLTCVWLDVDIKGGHHAAENLPTTEEAEAIINSFPLEPSIINHTGGGVHCYWLLDQPARIDSKANMESAERMLLRFQNVFIQLGRLQDFHIDKTADLARVLRVPATFNYKSVPAPVTTQLLKPDNCYSIRQLYDEIQALEAKLPAPTYEKAGKREYTGDIPDAKADRIEDGCLFIREYLSHKESAPYGEWVAVSTIAAYCEDGDQLMQSWSVGHPGYDVAEVDRKYHEIRQRMSPRTCKSIHAEFGACKGCPHFNKIKSPIALGMAKNELQTSVQSEIIPMPFHIKDNALYKTVIKKDGEMEVQVCRTIPKIAKELTNVERNSVHYELTWLDRGREKSEIVPASALSTKKEMMAMADSGFAVNDLNYKDLINYFDKTLSLNQPRRSYMVERLGHIKDAFIHPLASEGCEIVPTDIGERQLLKGFEVQGTLESWKTEVFDRIKAQPKVQFLVFASFASIMLHDLKVDPFIVDLSGSTSQGKTTALKVARSVWGNNQLINEWNTTKVSVERKAGFLNSFPLLMDDTRKADERILQPIVYQYSGGRSKGRGSVLGSQREVTWQNIMISTGEVSLAEYAPKAGGAVARVIPLVDEPFENVGYEYFSELYQAIDENYGAVGLAFIKEWQKQKDELIPGFFEFKAHYMNKAKGNEVLTRLSMYYAVVHFAGSVLRKIFSFPVDLKLLDQLFDEIAGENQATDKPKQLLEEILLLLDSSRGDICYDYEPRNMKAIYKFNTICLTPAFLKEFLGAEEKLIRREWMKRGFTQTYEQKGKRLDYAAIKHMKKTFRAVVVNKNCIDDLGLNFDESGF